MVGFEIGLAGGVISVLLAIIGWLLKRWMDSLDDKFETLFGKVDKIEDKFDTNFRNTQIYREALANDIRVMAVQMTVANGRTGKMEKNIELVEANIALEIGKVKGKLDTQIEVCKERIKVHDGYRPFGWKGVPDGTR